MEKTLLGLHSNGVTQERTWRRRAGWTLTILPALAMIMSAALKLSHAPAFADQWVNKFGFPEWELPWVGLLELACVTLYLIPRTAVLGAVLLAAFLARSFTARQIVFRLMTWKTSQALVLQEPSFLASSCQV